MTPRFPLGVFPTPLARASRLGDALGVELWLKRDDLAGFGVAGNKTRALEVLCGDALARGADTLVTGGGPDSNFVAAAALAARVAGLRAEIVVPGHAVPSTPNLDLARAAGATLRPLGDERRELLDAAVDDLAATLASRGLHPVALPRGGSTPLGALGFVAAAAELRTQLPAASTIVLPVGSGGSVAGLLAGLEADASAGEPVVSKGPFLSPDARKAPSISADRQPLADTRAADTRAADGATILAASVSRPPGEIGPTVLDLARRAAALIGAPAPDPARLDLVDARGPGFGRAAPADRDAAALALATEGLLLDDTYGAKTLAVLRERAPAGPVVLWHTGGIVSALHHLPTGAP